MTDTQHYKWKSRVVQMKLFKTDGMCCGLVESPLYNCEKATKLRFQFANTHYGHSSFT